MIWHLMANLKFPEMQDPKIVKFEYLKKRAFEGK